MVEIFQHKCKECGKEFLSLYKKQLENNIKEHMRTHKKENSSKTEREEV